jgi:hypothetical protein
MSKLRSQLETRGFAILPGVYGPSERRRMTERLLSYWRADGQPPPSGWGYGIWPLATKIPDLAGELINPALMEALAEVFGEEARVIHGGSRLASEQSAPAIEWHNHYAWNTDGLRTRTRCERVLGGTYLDGSSIEVGPLTAVPRSLNEPIGQAPVGDDPREEIVEMPPGSIVIFDTALWHRAKRGTSPGFRTGFGGHYQPASETRPHPEDNDVRDLNERLVSSKR